MRRLTVALAALACLALAVWLLWPYLLGALVALTGWRYATRGLRRQRPRSSWSSLGRTAALMYAAWNSRWLKIDRRVTVPARAQTAPREHDRAPSFDGPLPY